MSITTETLENLEYLEIESVSNVPLIKVKEVKVFLKLIKKFKPDLIYLCKNKYEVDTSYNKRISNDFLFYHNGAMYLLVGWNYSTIPDLEDGTSKGFKYGKSYHAAMEGGFLNFKEYEECTDLDYKTRSDYVNAEKLGFRGCHEKFKGLKYKPYDGNREDVWRNTDLHFLMGYDGKRHYDAKEGEIYYYAKKWGYKDFEEFCDGITRGFDNAKEYREAISKGFVHTKQYKISLKNGFKTPNEFEEAKKLEITTKKEYDKYLIFKHIIKEHKFETIEEAHLCQLLSVLKSGKKLSVSKLWEKLEEEKKKYSKDNHWHELPEWYTEKFEDIDDIKDFLSENKNIPSLGTYDPDGEVFERTAPHQINDKIVIIDGSNVAWNGGNKEKGDKPSTKNIVLVVDALKEKGFEKIIVIVDASLRHIIEDKNIFRELKNAGILNESPAKTDADNFIIKYAKEDSALIITNDTFRKDWKGKDPWVNENIDKYRVPFMIIGDVVKFDEKIDNRLYEDKV